MSGVRSGICFIYKGGPGESHLLCDIITLPGNNWTKTLE